MQLFIKSEFQLDQTFLLKSAQQKLQKQPPKVIVTDFSKGLTAALLVGQLIIVVLQYCQWHAVKVMKKWIDEGIQTKAKRPYGYLVEERKVVKELFQPYLKSKIILELKANQKAVLDKLYLYNKVQFQTIYIKKESQIITYYIR